MKISILSLLVLSSILFVQCEKDAAKSLDWEVVIEEVSPRYIAEGGTITLKGRGFTNSDSENKIEVNGIPADFKIRGEIVEVTVPEGTFDVNPFEGSIVFENFKGHRDTAVFYYEKYPRVYELHPERAYSGEIITIEGDYLDTNTHNTEILFTSAVSELISAEITAMDNYSIDVKVPNGAESGPVFYATRMEGYEKTVISVIDSVVVKK